MSEVQTRQQFWGSFEPKKAEAAGTHVMPRGASGKGNDKGQKFVIPKTAAVAPAPEGVEPAVAGEQPPANPQAKPLNPRVNVEGKEPPKPQEKKAGAFALPSLQRYPLNSFADVEKAASYFDEWGKQFVPTHRREYCVNLVKRASVLGIPLSEEIRKYGSESRAPALEVAIAIDSRRGVVTDQTHSAALSKLAEAGPTLSPELLVEALAQFDKIAGIEHLYDQEIPDPFWSVYGEKRAQGEGNSHILGNEVVSNKQLELLAKTTCHEIKTLFGEDFLKEFKKDPVGIFNSLPADQKKVLARMANDVHSP
jgi:hypothetical protein